MDRCWIAILHASDSVSDETTASNAVYRDFANRYISRISGDRLMSMFFEIIGYAKWFIGILRKILFALYHRKDYRELHEKKRMRVQFKMTAIIIITWEIYVK